MAGVGGHNILSDDGEDRMAIENGQQSGEQKVRQPGKVELNGYYVKRVGQNKGAPRIWLEGSTATLAGFNPGTRFDVEVQGQTVVLQANPDGSRVVSAKQIGERMNPVIDLNSKELLAVFDGMSAVRVAAKDGEIYLLPLASELKKQERFKRLKEKLESGDPLTLGSLSHGGGILSHAVHSGLAAAGVKTELGFANEIRGELLEHARVHNDAWSESTKVYAAPMQELAQDERGLSSLPRLEILEMGLPCSGASKAGKSKRGLVHAEAHPEVGHLAYAALVILSKTNPAVVLFENVPDYSTSASADILRNQLRDMGYTTMEKVLNGKEWGSLENRTRWCMVAVTDGIHFDFDQLLPPAVVDRKLSDVLELIADDDPRWSKMQGLKDKMVSDKLAGKNFSMQVFSADADHINTLTKGYAKVRSTDPKLSHATDPDLLRQLTPVEHARMKDVPEHLIAGLSATNAHEVLGQSVVYPPFKDVAQHVGNALNRLVGRDEVELANRVERSEAPAIPGAELVSPDVASIAGEVLTSLKLASPEAGRYLGRVVVADGNIVIQDSGRGAGVVHQLDLLNEVPKLGASVDVAYARGHGRVKQEVERHQSRETAHGR
jgi:DNA (cytosine-5)-methyltransferase 1